MVAQGLRVAVGTDYSLPLGANPAAAAAALGMSPMAVPHTHSPANTQQQGILANDDGCSGSTGGGR
jgi:hypothetical protein